MVGMLPFEDEEWGPQEPTSRAAIQAACSHNYTFVDAEGVEHCHCGLVGTPKINRRREFTPKRRPWRKKAKPEIEGDSE